MDIGESSGNGSKVRWLKFRGCGRDKHCPFDATRSVRRSITDADMPSYAIRAILE